MKRVRNLKLLERLMDLKFKKKKKNLKKNKSKNRDMILSSQRQLKKMIFEPGLKPLNQNEASLQKK